MSAQQIDGDTVRARVKAWFDASFGATPYEVRIDIGDARTPYRTIDPAEVGRVLAADPRVSRSLYRRGHFDCEDFAIAARAAVMAYAMGDAARAFDAPPAFGLLFTTSHATNIGVGDDGQPYLMDWYYDVLWRRPSLEGVLVDEVGDGWCAPRSVRYILI